MKRLASFILITVLLLTPTLASAATLGLYPGNTSAAIGGLLRVNVVVASTNQSVNAVSGTVSFPKDKLQLTSMSKDGSIITLWATEPSYSNGQGTANFEGIILNGYTGSYGQVITLVFKVIGTGDAPIVFSSASVLANDGEGTNVLNSTSNTKVTLTPGAIPQPSVAPEIKTVKEPSKDESLEEEVIELQPIVAEPVVQEPQVVSKSWLDGLDKYREFGLKIVDALTVTIVIASLVLMLIFLLLYTRVKIIGLRRKVRRDLGMVDYSVHKALTQLYAETTSHVKNIEHVRNKRELTAEEAVFLDRFKHRLAHIENLLGKEIKKIEKDIR